MEELRFDSPNKAIIHACTSDEVVKRLRGKLSLVSIRKCGKPVCSVGIVDQRWKDLKDPLNIRQALASPDKVKWTEAMKTEMEVIESNNVFELAELPPNRKALGTKWVLKKKLITQGEIDKYKARLVVQGFRQKYGSDFLETFAPVMRFETARLIFDIAAKHDCKFSHFYVSNEFL